MIGGALEVRVGFVGDFAGVAACDPLAVGGDGARATLLTDALMDGRCLVGSGSGTVVGFVVATPGRFFGRDFVDLLVVSVPQRRAGVGRLLLRAAAARAASADVWTSTNRSNEAMRALLTTEGWTYCGELVGLDDDDPELFFRTSVSR